MNITPDPEEIVQAEEDYDPTRPINVTVCGPVQTRALPAIGRPGYRTESNVTATIGVKLLAMEPRRQSAVIIAQTQDIWISGSQAGAQAGASGAFKVPAVVPFVVDDIYAVWACAVSGTTDISVKTTNWSE